MPKGVRLVGHAVTCAKAHVRAALAVSRPPLLMLLLEAGVVVFGVGGVVTWSVVGEEEDEEGGLSHEAEGSEAAAAIG